MKEKAVYILTLVKEDKSLFPGLLLLLFFLFTGYLLYPHNTTKPEVAGISDSKLPAKPTPTITPTPSIYFYKKTQSVKNIPTITASPNNTNTESSSPANTQQSNTNTSNNTLPNPTPSSNSNSDNQIIPTPTAVPEPSISPINNNAPTIIPTITPTENGNDQSTNTTVGTILGQVVTLIPNR